MGGDNAMLPATGVHHRGRAPEAASASASAQKRRGRGGKSGKEEVPNAIRMQRALIKWMSHSRFGALCTRVTVTVLHCIPLFSLLILSRRAWRLSQLMRRLRIKRPFIFMVGKAALESWAFLEIAFWLYFRWKRQSLEARRAYTPASLWKVPGERLRLLLKLLANIDRISAGNLEWRRNDSGGTVRVPSKTALGTPRGAGTLNLSPTPTHQVPGQRFSRRPSSRDRVTFSMPCSPSGHEPDASAAFKMKRLCTAPSVENFLRYQDEWGGSEDESSPGGSEPSTPPAAIRLPGGHVSVENLLRILSDEKLEKAEGTGEELMCLRHLELCSWYHTVHGAEKVVCKEVTQIRRGNIEEWILSYFFDGADSAESLSAEEQAELQDLVDETARWAGLPRKEGSLEWAAKNPQLRCFRLRNDPFPAVHRPLFTYAFTSLFFPLVGNQALMVLGFRPYRSGSTEYWVRPPSPSDAWVRSLGGTRPHVFKGPEGKPLQPLVFCHGIGAGPSMCLSFLVHLTRALGEEHPLFLVDTAAISMRFSDDVPCAREIAANMVDMLEVWGFKKAHFVGHSFGSFLLAWVLRYQRSYVARVTFMDPVCFLLLKVLAEGHELQQLRNDTRMDTMEIFIKYFVLTELFVCNFVCRCFFWEESQLDMEDLVGTEALLILESEDTIVPTHSVQRLVLAERSRRERKSRSAFAALDSLDAFDGRSGSPVSGGHVALDVVWVEGQPHAGFLVDPVVATDLTNRLQAFHSGLRYDESPKARSGLHMTN